MFLSYAAQALSKDEFSQCFEPQPTRHPKHPLFYWLYVLGGLFRYGILFPIRLTVLLAGTAMFLCVVPLFHVLQETDILHKVVRNYCRVWLFALSAKIRHHGRKPTFKDKAHLFVANHTSFIDYLLLSTKGVPHATVAQTHGGLFGWIQKYMLSANGSLFFNRTQQKDRMAVIKRMQQHANRHRDCHVKKSIPSPLLIFPEGTCVNNESTVLFHKGAFELDAVICPVAIKYNKRLLDPYWNTREQTFTKHVLYLMTRWMLVADVWWLDPVTRNPQETSIEFANRVKKLISDIAGLRNQSWDGYMKNCMRRQDQERMRTSSQKQYVSFLRQRMTPAPLTGGDTIDHPESEQVAKAIPTVAGKSSAANLDTILGSSLPSDLIPSRGPFIPRWLPDSSVVSIKNQLMLAASRNQNLFVQQLGDCKDDVVDAWRRYSRSRRRNLSMDINGTKIDDLRMENSSWRLWSKQRLDEQRLSPRNEDNYPNS